MNLILTAGTWTEEREKEVVLWTVNGMHHAPFQEAQSETPGRNRHEEATINNTKTK